MKKTIFILIALIFSLAVALVFWRGDFLKEEVQVNPDENKNLQEEKVSQAVQVSENLNVAASKKERESEVQKNVEVQEKSQTKVPFTSQAPTGNWGDERFQNGCEEASIMMAMKWIGGKSFSTPIETENEIKNIAKFEEKFPGSFVDASLEDVGKILSQYYGFEKYSIKHKVSLDDLKNEISAGNILLVPAYGRALKNPNYTSPGPITHMLVVVGYDPAKKEFITNDPGTKRGEGYRYNEKILFDAIWEYQSGKEHLDPPSQGRKQKGMLIISKI